MAFRGDNKKNNQANSKDQALFSTDQLQSRSEQ